LLFALYVFAATGDGELLRERQHSFGPNMRWAIFCIVIQGVAATLERLKKYGGVGRRGFCRWKMMPLVARARSQLTSRTAKEWALARALGQVLQKTAERSTKGGGEGEEKKCGLSLNLSSF